MKEFKKWVFILAVAGAWSLMAMSPAIVYTLSKQNTTN